MSNGEPWTNDQIEFLLILHDVLKYPTPHCATLMTREFKRKATKSSMLGLYHREHKKGFKLSDAVIAEVSQAAEL